MEYTEEQKKEIQERIDKAVAFLKELELTVQATVMATNVGNDVFGIKVVPFITDTKYSKNEDSKTPA